MSDERPHPARLHKCPLKVSLVSSLPQQKIILQEYGGGRPRHKTPLKKGGLNWGGNKLPTKHSSLLDGKPGTISLWVATHFGPMLKKFRPPGNEEMTSPAEISPEEWGSLIYTYVKDRGMSVCTFY